ncbi:ATP synthase subunit 9, mitochondrial [Cryptococcus neoformans C23]|uniref:ATP synthase subunit 9, mitochondrial n=1 Tax=Cryptococcus neoformans (strain H99 / ATCC 208821 / CBS 10515 / FGSC 9487) TaxID=235443 RepID=J9VK63_CRYN9|nr:ATP synthase subunit 9, mitochondrial [Cryptococcus neoformans var. grubii H99]AUB24316.1 ATP synthase subunit 9, mitochondrial [Cryptococcus neoformans var. grubii]OWZ32089.1 ATP synthase subunit 9, mitochondrial [Cryptococcus neoformans var. grubii AD2-60a]OWZ44757.1 ATP synthase subunit 9, mitochondrial [Cryptococcus neoformans var. grubii C23]OWZ45352.1 ATP synthase subunit 9, mitochondrial [Cryptococcus neoformans var. grubii AD1-83a]OXC85215.1 ATP synthase subunit 9, mitochondrial [Cr|eukprot:XP_012049595.1 ATP synthase subunit 9, mitochondrial [Cryptococcus neoformans var. grubii H99]
MRTHIADSSGSIFSSLIASVARNPALRGQLFTYAILDFALAEATGLFALMNSFRCRPAVNFQTIPNFQKRYEQ